MGQNFAGIMKPTKMSSRRFKKESQLITITKDDSSDALVELAMTCGFNIVEVWSRTVNEDFFTKLGTFGDGSDDEDEDVFRLMQSPKLCKMTQQLRAGEVVWKHGDDEERIQINEGFFFPTTIAMQLKDVYVVAYSKTHMERNEESVELLEFIGMAMYRASTVPPSPVASTQLPKYPEVTLDADASSHSASSSGHGLWASFRSKPAPCSSAPRPVGIPLLHLPTSQKKSARSLRDSRAGSARSARVLMELSLNITCRLSSRSTRDGFQTGVDVEELDHLAIVCSGAASQIFRAVHKSRAVVLKVIREDKINDETYMHEFNMEAEILSRVAHPNICECYGCGSHPLPFIVMEALQPLSGAFDFRGPTHSRFTFDMVLTLAKDLARALHYLHEEAFADAMIIHRDLKPDNLGIDASGNLKLFDFGTLGVWCMGCCSVVCCAI
jgi:hypothetical protein